MDQLFKNNDVVTLVGNPHLYDYYLSISLDKNNKTFEMYFGSNQVSHFSYEGTYDINDTELSLNFLNRICCYLNEKTQMDIRRSSQFSVIKENIKHKGRYNTLTSTSTVIFSEILFIDNTFNDNNEYVPVNSLPKVLYIM